MSFHGYNSSISNVMLFPVITLTWLSLFLPSSASWFVVISFCFFNVPLSRNRSLVVPWLHHVVSSLHMSQLTWEQMYNAWHGSHGVWYKISWAKSFHLLEYSPILNGVGKWCYGEKKWYRVLLCYDRQAFGHKQASNIFCIHLELESSLRCAHQVLVDKDDDTIQMQMFRRTGFYLCGTIQ